MVKTKELKNLEYHKLSPYLLIKINNIDAYTRPEENWTAFWFEVESNHTEIGAIALLNIEEDE